jgi:hypothetical protein
VGPSDVSRWEDLTVGELQQILAAVGIYPRLLESEDGTTTWGYEREQFETAWKLYGITGEDE